jgi:hypothetical protein
MFETWLSSKKRPCLSSVLDRHEEKMNIAARLMNTEVGDTQEGMRRNVVELVCSE